MLFCGLFSCVLTTGGVGMKGEFHPPLPMLQTLDKHNLSESGIICISGILPGPTLEARSATALQSWLFQD